MQVLQASYKGSFPVLQVLYRVEYGAPLKRFLKGMLFTGPAGVV